MDESRRLFLIGGVVVVVVVLLIGGYLALGGGKETYEVTVKSVPNDLTLTLDGAAIPPNGTVDVKEGRHTLIGQRRGFETYTQQLEVTADQSVKVYLFSSDEEGRAWEKTNPEAAREREAEVGRAHDEHVRRMAAKYPFMGKMPFPGNGFTLYYGQSKARPDDPEQLAFYVQLRVPEAEARPDVEDWFRRNGADAAQLELIYLPPKK